MRVDEIELTDYNDEEKTASIRVVCGKGTYIRSLARDIGRALDSGAYLTALRRTKAGSFAVENCISFDHFQTTFFTAHADVETSLLADLLKSRPDLELYSSNE